MKVKTRMFYGSRMAVSVSAVDIHDRVADWELWLTATAQYGEKVSYLISLAQEKMKIQNSKYSFYLQHTAFETSYSQKNLKSNHPKLGIICSRMNYYYF